MQPPMKRRCGYTMGITNNGNLCSLLNQCLILGLFLPLAFLIIVAHKDPISLDGHVREIRSAGSQQGSKSKPSRYNTFWDDNPDKSHLRPYFENTNTTNVTIQEGRTAFLVCRVRQLGDRTVSWIRRKDYHILTSGLYTFSTDQRFQALHQEKSDDWTLQVKYVQKRDAGIYECQVTWEKGVTSWYVTLNVVVPKATISAGAPEYYIKSGSTITLTCVITDSPDPSFVFWYHNDRMINYDTVRGGIQVETKTSTITTSTLFVADAQHADSGNYTCSSDDASPASITVHVLNGQYPGDKSAAMQHERQSSGSISSLLGSGQLVILFLLWACTVFTSFVVR